MFLGKVKLKIIDQMKKYDNIHLTHVGGELSRAHLYNDLMTDSHETIPSRKHWGKWIVAG